MPWQMADTMSRRPLNDATLSHAERDMAEDRYNTLRRPRKIRIFCNGDRFFKGKKMYITPHRYVTLQDLLRDLTDKLPVTASLPYGVRQIFTRAGGKKIQDIEDLKDGESYVCAGFEQFKPLKYGEEKLKNWSTGRSHATEQYIYSQFGFDNQGVYTHGAFRPNRLRQTYPRGRGGPPQLGYGGQLGQVGHPRHSYVIQSQNNVPMKPKVISVVRYGPKPRTTVKILLNRQSVQSYEQLMADIADSFGPKWRGQRISKLFSLRGKEVNGVSDFFRDDNHFIATGREPVALSDAQEIIEEFFPDRQVVQELLSGWQRLHKKKKHRNVVTKYTHNNDEDLKRDSGIGDSDESYRDEVDNQKAKVSVSYTDKVRQKPHATRHEEDNQNKQKELQYKVQEEKEKAAQDEKERARKRLQKRIQDERKIAEEDRRKQNQVPTNKRKEDPFKKIDADRKEAQRLERERKNAQVKEPVDEEEDDPKWRRLEWSQEEEMERSRKDKKQDRKIRNRSKISPPGKDESVSVSPGRDKLTPKVDDNPKSTYVSPSRATLTPHVENEAKKDVSPTRSIAGSKVDQNESTRQSRQSVRLSTSYRAKEDERNSRERISVEKTNRETDVYDTSGRERGNPSPHKGASSPQTRKQNDKEQGKTDVNTAGDVVNNNQSSAVAPSNEAKLSPTDNARKDGAETQQKIQQQEQQQQQQQQAKKKTKSNLKKGKLGIQLQNTDVIFEKYEAGRTLGDGNFAIVKQCKVMKSGHECAMKIIDKSKLKGKEHMVMSEIEVMKLCSHTNIVKLFEEYETPKEIYLIMELVKGGDLFDAITQSVKFPEPEAARMATDVAQALFYLHSRRIVHRDLKPENLLVMRNKDNSIMLKLADFGLAMEVKEPIFTVCGTPTYVAPEILTEIGYGLEVDMWALGVITYILLCGFPPFRSADRNQSELFEYIKSGEYEFLSPYWDGISYGAKDMIEHLLVVSRKSRFTAIDVLTHPWIVTVGGSVPKPDNWEAYRKNLRKQYEDEAKRSLESFREKKQQQQHSS